MSAQVFTLNFVNDDQLPDLVFEFEDQDLSVFTSITLRVRKQDGQLITKAAIIDDAANGLFHFEWAAGDLTAGRQEAEVVFVDALSKPLTFPDKKPLILIIREQV